MANFKQVLVLCVQNPVGVVCSPNLAESPWPHGDVYSSNTTSPQRKEPRWVCCCGLIVEIGRYFKEYRIKITITAVVCGYDIEPILNCYW